MRDEGKPGRGERSHAQEETNNAGTLVDLWNARGQTGPRRAACQMLIEETAKRYAESKYNADMVE
jgi:hypothetical protein